MGRIKIGRLLLAAAATCAVVSGSVATAQYQNPVLRREFPDPFIVKDTSGGWFYAYAGRDLNSPNSPEIQVARSKDLVNWTYIGNALPRLPSWASRGGTAPAVAFIMNQWVMYYSVLAGSQFCISVATASVSAGPDGPFVDNSTGPLVCQSQAQGGQSVDPYVFTAPDGARYLYWNSAGSLGFRLFGQQLSGNGLALTGSRVELLGPSQAWEKPCCDPSYKGIVEAPAVYHRPETGKYYLFYSGNTFKFGDYAMGVATGDSPLGPFTKASGPVTASSGNLAGPGSNGFIRDGANKPFTYYHSWVRPKVGYDAGGSRQLVLSPLTFDAGGRPTVTPTQSPLPSPAPLP